MAQWRTLTDEAGMKEKGRKLASSLIHSSTRSLCEKGSIKWSLNMFSVSQASTYAVSNSALSPLYPRASNSHSKMLPAEFLEKITLIWISAIEHLRIRIRASLTANTNHTERLPDSWIDNRMVENQNVLVKLVLNIDSALRQQRLQNMCSVKKHLLTYCPNIADS